MSDKSEVTRAILFADVCGSTRLYQRLGNQAARELIGAVLKDLTEITLSFDGERVKTIGDELMVAFSDPDAAARAAMQMQLRTQQRSQSRPLSVRIGFHWGSVIQIKNDYLGDAVNLAARVAGLATSERILTTQASRDVLSTTLQEETQSRGRKALKGIDAPIKVWEVLWRPATRIAPSEFASDAFEFAYTHLKLQYAGKEYVIDSSTEPLTIGRTDQNEIVINDECVSSRHTAIELWGGHFVLVDTSLNGIHIRIDGTPDSFQVPGQVNLRKSGTLWFGRYPKDPKAASATFACETREP